MNLNDAKTALRYFIEAGIPTALWGKPGIGKTDIAHQLAAEMDDTAIHVEALNLLESVDMRGLPRAVGDSVVWCIPEMFQKVNALAKKHTRVILFLDEWNTAPQSVMVPAAQLVWTGAIGPHKLESNVVIIAAGNRQ